MLENWGGKDYSYDGYDMMSGGNGYEVSHFAPSSKWYVLLYLLYVRPIIMPNNHDTFSSLPFLS